MKRKASVPMTAARAKIEGPSAGGGAGGDANHDGGAGGDANHDMSSADAQIGAPAGGVTFITCARRLAVGPNSNKL